MNKPFGLFLLALALAASSALAAPFNSPHNVVVLRAGTAATGSQGFLDEYTPGGVLVQSIALPTSDIVFGQSTALIHETSLSGDGAFVVIPGYAAVAASGNVEATTASANHRVIETVKYDGTATQANSDSHWASATTGVRGCAGDGFGNFWGDWTGGVSYLGNHNPYAGQVTGGWRASAVINGTIFFTSTLGVQYFNGFPLPSLPTTGTGLGTGFYLQSAASGSVYSSAGFVIPKEPFVTYVPGVEGSVAYIANYSSTALMITPFTWNGSSWDKQGDITLNYGVPTAHPLWLAVDYLGAQPILYFTTTVSANGVYTFTDTSVTGTMLWGTTVVPASLFTPQAASNYRGITMAPVKPPVPVFTQLPATTGGSPGDTVSFGPVDATGANPYAWTWQFNGVTLTNGNNGKTSTVGGGNTPTLWITNMSAADLGSYYAVASNNGGSTTSSPPALLTNIPSCINPLPVATTNCVGTTATFAGGVSGCLPLVSTNWYYNGNLLSDGPGPSGSSTILGSGTETLTIANAQPADAGDYMLQVVNTVGHASRATAPLTVHGLVIGTQPANPTDVAAGHTGCLTVVATGAGAYTYAWYKSPSVTPLTNGPTGTGASISGATTATMCIGNAQVADSGTYTCTVGSDCGALTTDPAVVTVGNPPAITTPLAIAQVLAGTDHTFTVGASGDPTLTYSWTRNGSALGETTSSLALTGVQWTDAGTYAVTVRNAFGSASSSALMTVELPPLTCQLAPPADQIVYEPFNYIIQATTQSSGNPWTALNLVTITNQATGVSLVWVNSGAVGQVWTLAQDMRVEAGFDNATYSPNGDSYPWPGLAGTDPQEVACNSANAGVGLPLGPGGSITNGKVYFSMICHVDQGSAIVSINNDYFCGFGTGTPASPSFNASIYIRTPGDDTYIPGVFKAGGGLGQLNPGVTGDWSSKAYHRGQIIFVVCRLTIHSGGGSTCDLWLDPSPFAFNASEADVPVADVANAGGSAPDVGKVDFFWIKDTTLPASRRFTDLRIGRTWASVTPPAPPTFKLANVSLDPGVTNSVFASHNVGNPVDCGSYAGLYQWSFNGIPLGDDGVHIVGSATATLSISNVQTADLGTYTVTGTDTDPLCAIYAADRVFNPTCSNFLGSASATLSFTPPTLSVAYSAPNATISWPTNWTGYTLVQTTTLDPGVWTTNSNPPYTVAGTNYSKSVDAASGTKFFRLIK